MRLQLEVRTCIGRVVGVDATEERAIKVVKLIEGKVAATVVSKHAAELARGMEAQPPPLPGRRIRQKAIVHNVEDTPGPPPKSLSDTPQPHGKPSKRPRAGKSSKSTAHKNTPSPSTKRPSA